MKTPMKFLFLLAALTGLTALGSGCLTTGQGQTVGIIYSVECGGLFAERCHVHVKSDAEASTDWEYCLDNESSTYRDLRAFVLER